MKNKNLLIVILVVVAIALIGWYFVTENTSNLNGVKDGDDRLVGPSNTQGLANPASVNCGEKGGTLTIETKPDGGQYGVCNFEDNMQCEEWALYRGDCPVGGVNVIGYDTPQQIFCAISGGQTLAVADATCSFPNGTVCSVEAFYTGVCGPDISPAQ